MKTIRIKIYRFVELSKAAQAHALMLNMRYNNARGISEAEMIDRLKGELYNFTKAGENYNGLTN